jgi:integrase
VDRQVEEVKTKKSSKGNKQAGVLRNDLPGFARVRGKKIYIRYKNKDIATGFNDTKHGWKLANDFWADKIRSLEAIESGEIKATDSIENIFARFIEYKKCYQKVTDTTINLHESRIKKVFADTKITLTERNIKVALEDFIRHCELSATSINIILAGIDTFLNWASDEEQKYLPKKNYIKKYKPPLSNKIKPPYTEEEYLMFVEHFDRRGKKEMSLFLQFLWETGARSKESINIKISDIDFEIVTTIKHYKTFNKTKLIEKMNEKLK